MLLSSYPDFKYLVSIILAEPLIVYLRHSSIS
uniref:Uncharacterized protein n=1 Tax=viral metagenome TaxID=1070528 RepID=A0A6C0IYU2_9ZZZZ